MNFTRQHSPSFRLTVDGTDITPTIQPRLQTLELREQNGETSDTLSLTLCDHTNDLAIPPHGAILDLAIGWRDALTEKGTFVVDEIEYTTAPNQLHIQARAADMAGALPLKTARDWQKTTLAQVVEDIARENDLTASISDTYTKARLATLHKNVESDLHFLTRLAKSHGALFSVKAGHLVFIEKDIPATASGETLPTINLIVNQLSSTRYVRQQRNNVTGVRARWRDHDQAKYVWQLAGDAERATDLSKTFDSAEHAQAEARAHWQELARGSETLFLQLASGDATLQVAAPLTVSGIKNSIDELTWQITEVRHTLGTSGFVSDVACERLIN